MHVLSYLKMKYINTMHTFIYEIFPYESLRELEINILMHVSGIHFCLYAIIWTFFYENPNEC